MENTPVTHNPGKEYFDNLMEKAAQEGVDTTLLDSAKKAMKFSDKSWLKKLMTCSPEEFYEAYAMVICSAALDTRTDQSVLADFFKKAKAHEGHEADVHGFFYNGLRFVAATLLGVIKFAWDLTFILGAFGVRFGWRLGKNLLHAVTKTLVETKDDAKYAGLSLQESFDRNILGRTPAVKPDETPSDVVITVA